MSDRAKGIASCLCVFAAWNWSRGSLQGLLPSSMSGTPRQRNRVYRFLVENFTIKTRDIDLEKFRAWTLFTAAFSHMEFSHIVGNLFGFHAFSRILIYSGIAPLRYAWLVIGSALAGNMGFLIQDARRRRPNANSQALNSARGRSPQQQQQSPPRHGLGLSGVVMGVGAAAACAAPRAQMLVMGVVPTPMWALMALYVLWDTYLLDSRTSKVGHAAHLGGAAFGGFYYLLLLRRGGGLPLRGMLFGR